MRILSLDGEPTRRGGKRGRDHIGYSRVGSLNETDEMITFGDKARFLDELSRIAAWFGPFGDQAMRESTYLIDKLIERF